MSVIVHSLDDVAIENTTHLLSARKEFSTTMDFLRNEDMLLPVFSTTVEDLHVNNLEVEHDLDGLVVEMKSLAGLKLGYSQLMLRSVDRTKVNSHWRWLKKHVPLKEYSKAGQRALKNSFGLSLTVTDGGYFLNISVLPRSKTTPSHNFLREDLARVQAAKVLNVVFADFKRRLKELDLVDMMRPTIMKHNLNDIDTMWVSEGDQQFILAILDQALMMFDVPDQPKLMLTLAKFGQKSKTKVCISDLVHDECMSSISTHMAMTVTSFRRGMHLFWSRQGLQQVVGDKGRLFPVLSLGEVANFQSNLDGQGIDLARPLWNVMKPPSQQPTVNFVQLYSVTPHLHFPFVPCHPVTATIVTCGLHQRQYASALKGRAEKYLLIFDDLCRKMSIKSCCRMEYVTYFEAPDIPLVLFPKDFFDMDSLQALIGRVPMVVPFLDNESGDGLSSVLQSCAQELLGRLRDNFRSRADMGGYNAVWESFQTELALEQFFYGQPFQSKVSQFSVSLGTDTINENSVTRRRGILGLSPIGSASVGESPPPLDIWIKDEVQCSRVARLLPLCDTLEAAPIVVGEALLLVLLGDIFQRNDRLPVAQLKSSNTPGKLVSHMTVSTLCEQLSSKKAFDSYPRTFGRARSMVAKVGKNVQQCLEQALGGFRYFPALCYWDQQGRENLTWNYKTYIELHKTTEAPSIAARAAVLSSEVASVIERRELTYSRNLVTYKEHGMPWMEGVLSRLPSQCSPEETLKILTLVSCAGLIQNGVYISYEKLSEVINELPIPQVQLKKLQVLSNLQLLARPVIWRIHESIPVKLIIPPVLPPAQKKPATSTRTCTEPPEQEEEERTPEDRPSIVIRTPERFIPASSTRSWSTAEMSIINLDSTLSHRQSYRQYVMECQRREIPSHSIEAFKRKRQRMMMST